MATHAAMNTDTDRQLLAQTLANDYRLSGGTKKKEGKVVERKKQSVPVEDSGPRSPEVITSKSKFQWIKMEDLDKEFENYNYDSDDECDGDSISKGSISQLSYNSACRKLKVNPIKMIYTGLNQKQLCIKNQLISPQSVKALTIALVKNVVVESLTFDSNELKAAGATIVASIIPQKLELLELNLTNNALGSKGAEVICTELMNNTIIRKVDLSGNNFNEDDAIYFRDLLEENNSIMELNLSHNYFQEMGGKVLAEGIAKNDFLRVLDLSWNHLRMSGVVAIGKSLLENTTLEVLRIGWNGVSLRGCIALGQSLSENNSLVELDLSCNRITDLCLGQLLKAFHTNTTLKILKLPLNQLSPLGCDILMKTLESHEQIPLQHVDLGNQSVKESFPARAKELKSTRNIDFVHGPILREGIQFGKPKQTKSDSLDTEDPFLILIVYMRLQNLRLLELFSDMDKDMSRSVTREEFKIGMKNVNIPLTEWQLDRLINTLDNDRNGDIDFSELVSGQKDYKARMYKDNDVVDGEETDVERVSRKIEIVMTKRFQMRHF